MNTPQRVLKALQDNIGQVVIGKDDAIALMLIALLCRGHVLIEDVPGVGKTTLASSLARSLDCSFARIQFTPDIMPSDITGFSIVNMKSGEMEYRAGQIMSQIVLADEINRTSPKTQSSLLEVMEENQVTVDGTTYPLPQPFIVLATQNPVEFVGTYPLPEAQLDRFFIRISLGYPTVEEEMDILARHTNPVSAKSLSPICSARDMVALQRTVEEVYCAREIRSYIASIVAATRTNAALQLGVSPRGGIFLLRASQCCALLSGRDFVLPDDVQAMVPPVLTHRLVLTPEARLRGKHAQDVLAACVAAIPVPVASQ